MASRSDTGASLHTSADPRWKSDQPTFIDTSATVIPLRCEACGGSRLTCQLGEDLKPDPATLRPCDECMVPASDLARVEAERKRLEFEIAGYRAALEQINDTEGAVECRSIAREALNGSEDTDGSR